MNIQTLKAVIGCVTLILLTMIIFAYMTYDYTTATYLSIIVFINLLLLLGLNGLNNSDNDFLFTIVIEQGWEKGSPYIAYTYKSRNEAEKRAKEERAIAVNTKAEIMMYESRVMDW